MGLVVQGDDVVVVVVMIVGFGGKREKVASARGWITVSHWLS